MRTKIEKYTAPDLSGFDKKLAVLEEQLNNVVKEVSSDLKVVKIEFESLQSKVESFKELEEGIKQSADDSRDYTKDIKRDLKAEMHHMSKQLDTVEKRGKEAFRQVRDSIDKNDTKVRTMVTVNSDRFDKRREQLRNDMDALELRMKDEMKELKKKVNDKIKKALENPLANMRK